MKDCLRSWQGRCSRRRGVKKPEISVGATAIAPAERVARRCIAAPPDAGGTRYLAAGNASKKLTARANPAKKDGVSDAARGTNPALPCCTGDKTAKRQADWNARARTTLKILNSMLRRPIIERPQCKPGRPFMKPLRYLAAVAIVVAATSSAFAADPVFAYHPGRSTNELKRNAVGA